MRVSLNLSAEEVKKLQRVAKTSRRTVAGEVAWAVMRHIVASGYVEPRAQEPAAEDPEDDEHPF